MGSGRGSPFGPRCHKGDIMGCGVLFPRNYECKSDSDEELEQQGGAAAAGAAAAADLSYLSGISGGGGGGGSGDSDRDDDYYNESNEDRVVGVIVGVSDAFSHIILQKHVW